MQNRLWKISTVILILALASLACGLNVSMDTPSPLDVVGTTVGQTLAAFTEAASHGTILAPSTPALAATLTIPANFTPLASVSATFAPTKIGTPSPSGPENALVTTSGLCWLGPGPVYEVSSSIMKGTRVQIIARGDAAGWLVLRNPKYHDPCWMPNKYLQLDSSLNLLSLPVFITPPTPTATP